MSLAHEQRYLLEELREYLRRVEKMTSRYNIDLDHFAIDYQETGYDFNKGASPLQEISANRRRVFSRAAAEEKVNYYQPESD
jgi:hypothetical protein